MCADDGLCACVVRQCYTFPAPFVFPEKGKGEKIAPTKNAKL